MKSETYLSQPFLPQARKNFFKFSFENENKCNKYTFSECDKETMGGDNDGTLLYA